jgi:CRP-like cAMP-binding protein
MNHFLNHLTSTVLKKRELVDKLQHLFTKTSVEKGTILLRPDEQVTTAWHIHKGILRAYYELEERKRTWKEGDKNNIREVTPWLVPAPGFLTDIPSFLHQQPSTLFVEALEDCELYCLTFENYKKIYRELPDLAESMFERSVIMADSRVKMMNLRDGKARLTLLEDLYPGIANRVSVNIIASYINVDPSTLSRMRGGK